MRQLKLRIRRECNIKQVVQKGAYTFVEVTWGGYIGQGFSKWNPNDKGRKGWDYSKDLGIIKATNRAVDDIVRQKYRGQIKNLLLSDWGEPTEFVVGWYTS